MKATEFTVKEIVESFGRDGARTKITFGREMCFGKRDDPVRVGGEFTAEFAAGVLYRMEMEVQVGDEMSLAEIEKLLHSVAKEIEAREKDSG